MLSPKIGLTNGSGAAAWGGAPKALPQASANRQQRLALVSVNLTFLFLDSRIATDIVGRGGSSCNGLATWE
jgi:hypothetical protein